MNYHVLRVNLTTGKIQSDPIPDGWLEKFIGGKGLAAAYLYKDLKAGVDPLSPENLLIFAWGPLVGLAPGATRYCVATKSPHSGTFADSYSGGFFPSAMRHALPDHMAILFTGRAKHPVYLQLEDGKAQLKDAFKLWGMTISQTCQQLEQYKVACIGPAGEHLVKFATVSSDYGTHHAGRGGGGAVMGSKNLKAVAAKGKKVIPAAVRPLVAKHMMRLTTGKELQSIRDGGTPQIVDITNATGTLPTRNWTAGTFEGADQINLDQIKANSLGKVACDLCGVACGFNVSPKTGPYAGIQTGWGPEYETIGMNGSNCCIDDLSTVAKIATLCDQLGMDSISLGNAVSFAMECSQKGLIDYKISFGDREKSVELIQMIAHRQGIGDLLAEGTRRAAEKIGKPEALEAAVEVKHLELPAYDPRGSFSMALAYATSDRGACHMRAWPIASDAFGGKRDPYGTAGHAKVVMDEQHNTALEWSLIGCAFTGYGFDYALEWLPALGYSITSEQLSQVGERIWNLTRMFNVREGFTRKEDSLPARLKRPLQNGGPADGKALTDEAMQVMLQEYYQLRGWDDQGRPTPAKLKALGLDRL